MTDNEKKSVSNISTLTNARKTFERLYSENKKEKIQNAKQYFSNFSKEKDEFQDVVWYYHKNMPEYIDIRSYVIPFFYIEDDNVKIQIRYNYTGDDWIFFKQVTILADGKKYNKTFDYFNGDNKVPTWQKRCVLVVSIAAMAGIYIAAGYDNAIMLVNSAILAPVFWSWVVSPILKKLGVGYKDIDNTIG